MQAQFMELQRCGCSSGGRVGRPVIGGVNGSSVVKRFGMSSRQEECSRNITKPNLP